MVEGMTGGFSQEEVQGLTKEASSAFIEIIRHTGTVYSSGEKPKFVDLSQLRCFVEFFSFRMLKFRGPKNWNFLQRRSQVRLPVHDLSSLWIISDLFAWLGYIIPVGSPVQNWGLCLPTCIAIPPIERCPNRDQVPYLDKTASNFRGLGCPKWGPELSKIVSTLFYFRDHAQIGDHRGIGRM